VYRYEGFREPAFFLHEVRPESELSSPEAMGTADLRRIGYVQDNYDGPRTFSGVGTVSDFREEHGDISVQVDTPEEQFLLITTTWYPYWRATVSGQRAAVYRVDGSFLAVRVPAGRHEVALHFTPTAWTWLLVLNIAVLTGLAGFCGLCVLRRLLAEGRASTQSTAVSAGTAAAAVSHAM
jgi:hypothetical protein